MRGGIPVFRALLGHSCLSNRKKEFWRRNSEAWGPGFTSESSSFYLSSKGFWPLCESVTVGREGEGWQ